MTEFLLLLFVRFGMPVALLFLAGYLARRYQAHLNQAFEALAWAVPAGSSNEGRACPPTAGTPCWEVKQCPLAEREKCPAYTRTYLPCWLARKLANGGRLERACLDCVLYQPERAVKGLTPLVRPVGAISHPATTLEGS